MKKLSILAGTAAFLCATTSQAQDFGHVVELAHELCANGQPTAGFTEIDFVASEWQGFAARASSEGDLQGYTFDVSDVAGSISAVPVEQRCSMIDSYLDDLPEFDTSAWLADTNIVYGKLHENGSILGYAPLDLLLANTLAAQAIAARGDLQSQFCAWPFCPVREAE